MADFTCPYCLRTYNKSKVKYVCPECNVPTEKKAFAHEPIKCKMGCGGYATKRVCPYCDGDIPKIALETPNLPFSIVGVSGSGKTNYITVMLRELNRASGLQLALGHQTNETRQHQNEMISLIFESHEAPQATDRDNTIPQIWYIKNLQKKRGSNVPTYTFTIFDGAGEAQEGLDPSSTECRYIGASKAIVLTIDPLVLPSICNGGIVDPDVLRNSRAGEVVEKNASEVINNIVDYIKTARGIKTTKMLDIPVAVVLTKIDTVLSHPAFANSVIQGSSLTIRNGKVELTEMKQVDSEIRDWLLQIGEDSFINTLDANFKEYMFFGVSSFGAPPVDEITLPKEIHPHRVLDPILWLFKREKFID